jgi:enolase
MAFINTISARWILDSRGYPTIYCELVIDQNGRQAFGRASVPSGASTGKHEALELRDGEKEFNGKGVNNAIHNILTTINDTINSMDFANASEVDQAMLRIDKTENKSILGANAVLAVSIAAHRAFAELYGLEVWQYLRRIYFSYLPAKTTFPRLMMNILNGGQHADNPLDVQEFMIVPRESEIAHSVRIGSEIYHTLKRELKTAGQSTGVGDEGGFAPDLESTEEALRFVRSSVKKAGYQDEEIDLALDVAASEVYEKTTGVYTIDGEDYRADRLISLYSSLVEKYGIVSIEDGLDEDDLDGWKKMTDQIGFKTQLVGDDLFVTNIRRFQKIAVDGHIANAALIKPNQIGSIKETCDMINMAKENNYRVVVSHRSGETMDDFISDLAYASQADFLKAGAPARGERVAKYNRLLDIYSSLLG